MPWLRVYITLVAGLLLVSERRLGLSLENIKNIGNIRHMPKILWYFRYFHTFESMVFSYPAQIYYTWYRLHSTVMHYCIIIPYSPIKIDIAYHVYLCRPWWARPLRCSLASVALRPVSRVHGLTDTVLDGDADGGIGGTGASANDGIWVSESRDTMTSSDCSFTVAPGGTQIHGRVTWKYQWLCQWYRSLYYHDIFEWKYHDIHVSSKYQVFSNDNLTYVTASL